MHSNNATGRPVGGETPKSESGEAGDRGREDGRDNRGRFQRDVFSPHRGSRPRGSRNKLAEDFLGDLAKLWEEQGEAILRRAAFENPVKLADIVARLLPAKIEIKNETLLDAAISRLDDEQRAGVIEALQAEIERKKQAQKIGPLIDVTPLPSAADAPAPPIAAPGLPAPQDPVVEPLDPFAEFEAQLAREAKQAGGGDDGSV
jgi:hypothetical protein